MKHLLLLLLSLVFSYSLSAQLLTGARAASVIPEAHLIRYDGDQSLPQFIRLKQGIELPIADAPAFLKTKLQLPADHDFTLINVQTDHYGIEHHRFRQTVGGHPVIGGVYLFHGKNGLWTEANGELHLPESNTANVLLTPEAAIANAIQERPAEVYGWEAEHPIADYPTAKLSWVSTDLSFRSGTFRLTYELFLYRLKPHSHERLFIDATTGAMVTVENQIHTYHEEQDVPGLAKTRYSGLRPINTTYQGDSVYVLQETGRGQGIFTYNSENRLAYPYTNFEDADNYWENVNAQRDEVATDCHWGAEKYYDLLRYSLNRNSIDGQGEALESHVHYDQNYANAFWDGRRSTFGDGSPDSRIDLPLTTLDVVAHEFTHGLTDRTSDLVYAEEYGALNESFSDIFGVATVFTYRPEDASWIIGADLSSNGQGIRNMRDPLIFGNPKTYRGTNWTDGAGVHTNSGVQNHWFYLLTTGGNGENELGDVYNLPGLGVQLALEVAYRNNAFYLTETSNYADAGFNSALAAAAIFGSCSPDIAQVIEAWKAVGVYVPNIPTEAVAEFSVGGPFCSLTDSISFTNSSYGEDFVWDFGDGTTSTERSPKHLYTNPGIYTVSLSVENCFGSVAQQTQPDVVVVDPDNIYCNFVSMPAQDTVRIAACNGVLYDSGGPNSRYADNEASVMTIENPLGTPIKLTVVFFQSQAIADQLRVMDGDTDSEVELAVLSGLRNNLVIQGTQPVITLRWSSDNTTRGTGWEIRWGDEQSNSPANASFAVSTNDAQLNQLVRFTTTAPIPGFITYDFGDGSPAITSAEPVEYAYTAPGTYQVRAIDQTCAAADTTFQTITVSAGTAFSFTPTALNETLNAGEQVTRSVHIANTGGNNGFYQATLPDFSTETLTSTRNFSISNRTTQHQLTGFPQQLQQPVLNIAIDGDFGAANNTAEVSVEGEVIGTLGGVFIPSAFRLAYTPTEQQLSNWLADGVLDVTIVSSNTVSTIGYSNVHSVSFSYNRVPYLTSNDADQEINAGASGQLDVLFDATELLPGLYLDTIYLRSSDENTAVTAIPTSLLVRGVPRIAFNTEQLNFGYLAVNQARQRQLVISNVGTADLTLDSISVDNELYTTNFQPTVLAPEEEYVLTVDFTGANLAGEEPGLLRVFTAVGARNIELRAVIGDLPSVVLSTEVLTATLPTNTTTVGAVELSNDSPSATLDYDITLLRTNQSSAIAYTNDNDTTVHVFNRLSLADYEMEIILQGDFSSSFERARLFINGELRGFLEDQNVADNEPDTITIALPRRFFSTGELNITIINAGTVRWEEEYANLHTVNLYQSTDIEWLTRLTEVIEPLDAGQDIAVPFGFNANGLAAGTYFATLKFTSTDPDEQERLIPVEMYVTGTPELRVSTDTLDFFGLELGVAYTQPITFRNDGSAVLNLAEVTSDNAQFVVTTTEMDLRPGEMGTGTITFTPTAIGPQAGLVTFTGTDIASQTILVRGEGIGIPLLDLVPDTICVSLLAGTDTLFTGLPIGNIGETELRYDFGQNAGKLLVWDYAQNIESYATGVAPVLDNYGDALAVTTLTTTDPTTMAITLAGTDILLIAPMEAPNVAVLQTMRDPIRRFMNRGGRVILLAGIDGEVPFNLGILTGSAVRTNPSGIPIRRTFFDEALFAGITDTLLTSTEETNFIVGFPGNGTQVVGRMYGQACMIKGTRERGGFIYLGYTFEETSDEAAQVLSNAIGLMIGAETFPEWLSVSPTIGTLAAGESDDRQLTFTTGELAPGDYYYNGTVRTNAPGTSSGNYVVKLTVFVETAVEDAPNVTRLVVYPNPTNGPLLLDMELQTPLALHWRMTDALGRLVSQGKLAEATTFNQPLLNGVTTLASGVYQLQLRNAQGEVVAVRRVVVE